MLSFPDPQGREYLVSSFDDGHDIAPAVYLAVKQVNNQTDLLKDYNIEILRLDGGCDATTRTVIGANELICSCKKLVGIIGPSCKLSSKTVSHIINQKTFSMITISTMGMRHFLILTSMPIHLAFLEPVQCTVVCILHC